MARSGCVGLEEEAGLEPVRFHGEVFFVGSPFGEPEVGQDHAGLGCQERECNYNEREQTEPTSAACEVHVIGFPVDGALLLEFFARLSVCL